MLLPPPICEIHLHHIAHRIGFTLRRPPKDHNSLAYYYMEQKSVEYADARVSPSMYFFEWMQDTGYDFPAQSNFVLQNTLHPLLPDVQTVTHRKVNHIVFFGRLEIRKGLLVFINALNLLGDQVPAAVTFLGPSTSVDGVPAREVIRKHYTEHNWNFTLHIAETYDTEQALAYMQDQKAIAVMPTLGDNSPYALMEVIASNIPVITSLAGGCHELIDTPAGKQLTPTLPQRSHVTICATTQQASRTTSVVEAAAQLPNILLRIPLQTVLRSSPLATNERWPRRWSES